MFLFDHINPFRMRWYDMFDGMSAALGVTLIATILLIVINAFYRFLANQDRAAELKARMQELNAESKKAPPDRQKELMSETMKQQRELMHLNTKPMLLSFVIVALLLPWLGTYYNDVNVGLNDGMGVFSLSVNGNYTLTMTNGSYYIAGSGIQLNGHVPSDIFIAGNTWHISETAGNVRLSLIAATLPAIPLVGGWQLGWIWWYILVSIPLAIIIRAAYGIRA